MCIFRSDSMMLVNWSEMKKAESSSVAPCTTIELSISPTTTLTQRLSSKFLCWIPQKQILILMKWILYLSWKLLSMNWPTQAPWLLRSSLERPTKVFFILNIRLNSKMSNFRFLLFNQSVILWWQKSAPTAALPRKKSCILNAQCTPEV